MAQGVATIIAVPPIPNVIYAVISRMPSQNFNLSVEQTRAVSPNATCSSATNPRAARTTSIEASAPPFRSITVKKGIALNRNTAKPRYK
jgi:hypothetical protein